MRAAAGTAAGLVGALAVGCASQGAPPGGPEDRRPPVVVRTEPEPFARVEDLGATIRFHFDERISEQVQGGRLEDAVTVSPRGGELEVSKDSRSLSIQVQGGLRAGLVYRVTLQPVISDLFGNQLRDPFELVFSTGGEPEATAVAGEIWDRISGQGVRGAMVQAVGADSLQHLASADDRGIFAFRFLPVGSFVVTGFVDQNRNGRLDAREAQGSMAVDVASGDTVIVDVPVLAPDTTPAILARVATLDSLRLVLEFDDYLDPTSDTAAVEVTLGGEGGPVPGVSRVFHEHQYAEYVTQVSDSLAAAAPAAGPPPAPVAAPDTATAAADSAAAAATALDSTATRPAGGSGGGTGGPPSSAAGAPRPGGPPPLPGARSAAGGRGSGPAGRLLPGRRLAVLLDAPLEVGEYQVRVAGVVNLNGLLGGGGEADLVREATPVPDPVALPDSASAPDTTAAPPPDSAAVGGAPPGGNRR